MSETPHVDRQNSVDEIDPVDSTELSLSGQSETHFPDPKLKPQDTIDMGERYQGPVSGKSRGW